MYDLAEPFDYHEYIKSIVYSWPSEVRGKILTFLAEMDKDGLLNLPQETSLNFPAVCLEVLSGSTKPISLITIYCIIVSFFVMISALIFQFRSIFTLKDLIEARKKKGKQQQAAVNEHRPNHIYTSLERGDSEELQRMLRSGSDPKKPAPVEPKPSISVVTSRKL